jgi:hypothetical protein
MRNSILIKTVSQFHHHFSRSFFCIYTLVWYFFGARMSVQVLKWLVKLTQDKDDKIVKKMFLLWKCRPNFFFWNFLSPFFCIKWQASYWLWDKGLQWIWNSYPVLDIFYLSLKMWKNQKNMRQWYNNIFLLKGTVKKNNTYVQSNY